MEDEAANEFLDDFAVSDDPHKPIPAGLFLLEAGQAMTYTYTADSDQTVEASRGDLFYFPQGSTITPGG